MGRQHHHHHHHHKSHGWSNCCIALNMLCFLITLITGSIVVGVLLRPSMEYIDGWNRINCTLDSQGIGSWCQEKACQQSTNQVQFPSYFYDNGHRFPFEYDANDSPFDDSGSESAPNNTCPASTSTPCYNGTIGFHYQVTNVSQTYNQSLYVAGDYKNAYSFVYHFNQTFHCWVDNSNSSRVSVLPIPKYSPGGAIATAILFSFSLLCLILLFIFISIRCFCRGHEYQPIYIN